MPSQKTRNYCPRPEELLNKRSKLISKCGQANKFFCVFLKQIAWNPFIAKQH